MDPMDVIFCLGIWLLSSLLVWGLDPNMYMSIRFKLVLPIIMTVVSVLLSVLIFSLINL